MVAKCLIRAHEVSIIAKSLAGNRFDRLEWAGAFWDLGTLIPVLVAYVTLLDIEPFGALFAFGVAKVVSGLYYKTPFPIQLSVPNGNRKIRGGT
ncbi:MAG: hypothetical protein BMS9Abin01_0707 [Gammaproteobacteria bacterium]|nr:MAG: hypothetical protein BMS9Abin01_0707 [Gammaproteobacteria bacterium]